MAAQLVIGLFHSGGVALDAYHRLRTEGMPAHRLAHRVLKEVAPPPPTVQTEFEALDLDPLVWGDVRRTFAPLIHNGETAVLVDAANAAEAEFTASVLKLYNPISIETMPAARGR
jgi:hypothetical protein